ncbi:MAG: DUF4396 domain-containing protein [Chitinophagales bacterium]
MTESFQVKGMTCTSCEGIISHAVKNLPGISEVRVSKQQEQLTIVANRHFGVKELQEAVGQKYLLKEITGQTPVTPVASGFSWNDVSVWKRAGFNTLNCLIGCSIGDFAMVVFLQHFYPNTPMSVQMTLSVIAGLFTSVTLETTLLHYREKLFWQAALKMAVSMSFISMVAMEIAMDTTDFMITGGKMAVGNPAYWLAFVPSLAMGFLVPLPYNYYQLKKHNRACH